MLPPQPVDATQDVKCLRWGFKLQGWAEEVSAASSMPLICVARSPSRIDRLQASIGMLLAEAPIRLNRQTTGGRRVRRGKRECARKDPTGTLQTGPVSEPRAKVNPSSAQPVMPPIITFTLRPNLPRRNAALSVPLQCGPAQ